MAISSITQADLFPSRAAHGRGVASPPAPAATKAAATSQPEDDVASSTNAPASNATAAVFQPLTRSLQALLLQLQGSQASGASPAADAAGPVTAARPAPNGPPIGVMASAEQVAVATKTELDTARSVRTASSGPPPADPGPPDDSSGGISASFFGAYRSYASTNSPPRAPAQLGFA